MKKLLTILLAVALCVPIAVLSASCGESKTLKSISVDITNAKTTFVVGEDYSSEGLVVKAKYSDNSEVTLNANEYTINSSAYKKAEEGTYEISVFYGEQSAKYNVTVLSEKALAKACLDNWSDGSSWIKNINHVWYGYDKDYNKVLEQRQFMSADLLYGSYKDYTEDKSIFKEDSELWIKSNVGYKLTETEHTKKTYFSMNEAAEDLINLQTSGSVFDDSVSIFSGIKWSFKISLATQDSSIVISDEDKESFEQKKQNTEIQITIKNSEISVLVSYTDNEFYSELYVFDRATLSLKYFKYTEGDLSEFGYGCDNATWYYYFNTTPTERMTTPPTDVDWTELN